MGADTKIQWAHHTFNPWTGCEKVSPGCEHCYAEAWAKRSGLVKWGKGQPRRRTSKANWKEPVRWNAAAEGADERPRVFCASLADWLDDAVPIEWLADLLQLIHETPNLDWLLLTKRPGNFGRVAYAAAYLGAAGMSGWTLAKPWVLDHQAPPNVWVGTTVEDQKRAHERIPLLGEIPARVRFLSCEPLLEEVELRSITDGMGDYAVNCLERGKGWIHWVICGGESGPKARAMEVQWAMNLRCVCGFAGVPFFMKQLGGAADKRGELAQFPEYLRVREVPA